MKKKYNKLDNKKSKNLNLKASVLTLSLLVGGSVSAGKNLLVVNASPDLENSHSRSLARHFVEQVERRYPGQYNFIERDLEKTPIPSLRSNTLEIITAGNASTPEARSLLDLSDALINEIEQADGIVIAAPMHNFTVPSSLKSYFDVILRAGRTFKYTAEGPVGMLSNRPAMLLYASGGCYGGTDKDYLSGYVGCILRWIGIQNYKHIAAEGLAMQGRKEFSLQQAKQAIEEHLDSFLSPAQ